MAFLGPSDLKALLNDTIITPFNAKRIEQAAYELSLGSEVYRTDAKDGKIELLDNKNKTVEINPGQFTLLLTKETVSIPPDKLAFISIKAKQKLKGLINVSGFHVDPGFNGQLLFSVYNAGPSTITLETDKPYFLIWFADLNTTSTAEDLYNSTSNNHQNQKGIPTDYIDALKRGELASPNFLLERIKSNENLLNKIFWAAGIIIALATAITLKVYADSRTFEKGVEYGKKEIQIAQEIRLQAHKYLTDSVSLYKVDSLINIRMKQVHEETK